METREEKLEIIREKCIEANKTDDRWNSLLAYKHPIRLAYVLLAIGETATTDRALVEFIYTRYNLRNDDLTQQSEETITFLADLLS